METKSGKQRHQNCIPLREHHPPDNNKGILVTVSENMDGNDTTDIEKEARSMDSQTEIDENALAVLTTICVKDDVSTKKRKPEITHPIECEKASPSQTRLKRMRPSSDKMASVTDTHVTGPSDGEIDLPLQEEPVPGEDEKLELLL